MLHSIIGCIICSKYERRISNEEAISNVTVHLYAVRSHGLWGEAGRPPAEPPEEPAQEAVPEITFPEKDMKVIVPFSPGGAVDATCRLIAEAFPQYMGDNKLIVENVAGGGAIIGQAQAVTSPADGYTMLATTTSFVTNTIMNDTPFEYTDVEPIAMYSFDAIALVVPVDSQFQTLQEFAVYAKDHEVVLATSGHSTT